MAPSGNAAERQIKTNKNKVTSGIRMKDSINQQAKALDEDCTRCQACVSHCAFLQKNGTPGDIAAVLVTGKAEIDPFACSLCNLCAAVCPAALDPAAFFLDKRRQMVNCDQTSLHAYSSILKYEQRGSSRLFSGSSLPSDCDTVFFPGCTLPGTRPETTWSLYQQLKTDIPQLGMILDCCHKPSHDLGRQDDFLSWFAEMHDLLLRHGVRHIIVACPNCYTIFHEYGQGLTVRTAWDIIAETASELPLPLITAGQITVHDPCPLRDHQDIQQAVRIILLRLGLTIREMDHSRSQTICCGEGGSVAVLNPELAGQWGAMRKMEAGRDLVISYCAGCTAFLARIGLPTIHLGDLLVNPEQALAGKASVARAPMTYLNRIKLKRRLQKAGNLCPEPILAEQKK